MGMFDKMKEAQAQAAQMGAGVQMGSAGGMAGQAAYAQLAQKLAQTGVEAPGVVHSIAETGSTDMGGGQETKFEVSIKPADGEPFQTTITQSMLPAQLEGIAEGSAITVKYDPDSPTSALIYGW
jgi:ribosomal protein L11